MKINNTDRRAPLVGFLLILISSIALGWNFNPRTPPSVDDLKPTLLLISIDGFRASYFEKYQHPALNALAAEGVRAQWMTPSYPSLTFPNHYAISTGLYPSDNGIVSNDIYDPDLKAIFGMSKRAEVQDGRWWLGEPIWITAEKQGQRSAPVFFPGTEAEIEGTRPTFWKPYDDKVTPPQRVDAVLSLLDLPAAQRPTFLTLYFSDVDHAGHEFSPDSAEVKNAVTRVDSALDRLVRGLRTRNIYDKLNIIIVSDHGMTTVVPTNVVLLDDYFPARGADHIVWNSEVTSIFPKTGGEQALFATIKTDRLKHAQCYRKQDIPARFHYQASRRIGGIVCMAAEGWRIFSHQRWDEELKKPNRPTHLIGAHGYDNQLPSMRAIFIARGPAFKSGIVVTPFPNVDVYDIMTSVLSLQPAKNDGEARTGKAVLR